MRFPRVSARLAAVMIVLLFAPALPLGGPAAAAPTPLASQGVLLPLYIHADNTLTMTRNTGESSLQPFTQRQWEMSRGVTKTVCMDGSAPGPANGTFAVRLNLTGPPSGANPYQVSMYLKDEGTIIAQQSQPSQVQNMTLPITRLVSWDLAPTANRTSCNILTGHRLQLEVVSGRNISVDALPGANVALYVWDVITPDASTANAAGPTNIFYPNDADGSRQVIVRGHLYNALTPDLVSNVGIQIRDPVGTAIYNASATLQDDNYTYTWNYAKGLQPGDYTAAVTVTDTSGNMYNASAGFSFVAYGLRIDAPGAAGGAVTGYTTQGVPAEYELTVTNVGGSPTGVLMATDNAPAPGWSTNFSRPDFPLEPGASYVTYFHVIPADPIGPGNSTQITVVAQAKDDPSPIKARAFLSTTTIIRTAINIRITPHQTDGSAKLSDTARYDFLVNNSGGIATDVILNATAAPVGWSRDLAAESGGNLAADGNGWRLLGLPANNETVLTLYVFTPNSSSGETTFVCTVTARSAENTTAGDSFIATTRLLLGIELTQKSPIPTRPTAPPGSQVIFLFDVANTDPLNRHTVSFPPDAVAESPANKQVINGNGGEIEVTAPTNCCDGGHTDTLTVRVLLPSRALAGIYEFQVAGTIDGDANKVVQINFSLTVASVYAFGFRYADDLTQVTLYEGAATLQAFVENVGNVRLNLSIKSSVSGGRTPATGWSVTFVDSSGVSVTHVEVDPYETVPVNVTIAAARDAFNGETRKLQVTLERVGSTAVNAPALTMIVQISTSAAFSRMLYVPYFPQLILFGFLVGIFATWLALESRKKGAPRPPKGSQAKPAGAKGTEQAPAKAAPLK